MPGAAAVTIIDNDAVPADLAITKTAGGGPFFATLPMTFNIGVSNAGPNAASAVVVTDVLPAGTTLVSATPSQGSCSGTTTVTCSLGVIANGGNATIVLRINPSASGPLSNTATVTDAPRPDPNAANNSSTATVTVGPASAIPLFGGLAPQWTPDGKHVLFVSGTKLAAVDVVSKQVRDVPIPRPIRGFAIAPDGRALYLDERSAEADIWLVASQ